MSASSSRPWWVALYVCICVIPCFSQITPSEGFTPVPAGLSSYLSPAGQPTLTWEPVAGHGPQTGLHTRPTYSYEGYDEAYGTEFPDWDFGDPMEVRRMLGSNHTVFYSSSGFDVFYLNARAEPDDHSCVFVLQEAAHTAIPLLPSVAGLGTKSKYDQLHYFNADSTKGAMDMIDFSALGVTHPDQLIWYEAEGSYKYSYLCINDNDDSDLDIIGAVLIRADRLFGRLSLTENIIYAEGQTTYNVYRRAVGGLAYELIASELTDNTFTDETAIMGTVDYEYVVTANDMFGESELSATVGSADVGLPVEWLQFDAHLFGAGQIQLQWTTASERNNAHFIIERSADAQFFEAIGLTPGVGNSDAIQTYRFLDHRALNQTAFYRLRQVDLDGTEHFSEVLTVNPAGMATPTIQVFPNPSKGLISLQGLIPGHTYDVRVIDTQGRHLRHIQLQAGPFDPQLDLSGLLTGVYHLQLHNFNLKDAQHLQVVVR